MALQPGVYLGPYGVLSALGAGGMGDVYKARDPRLERAASVIAVRRSADPTIPVESVEFTIAPPAKMSFGGPISGRTGPATQVAVSPDGRN